MASRKDIESLVRNRSRREFRSYGVIQDFTGHRARLLFDSLRIRVSTERFTCKKCKRETIHYLDTKALTLGEVNTEGSAEPRLALRWICVVPHDKRLGAGPHDRAPRPASWEDEALESWAPFCEVID